SPTLKSDEVGPLLKTVKENITIPVIAGVGTNCTQKTIDNIKNIRPYNVDGLLVIVPYYNKPNQDSIYAHFSEVAKNTDLPIMMYNVPGRTGANMLPDTVSKLSKIENIVAVKEASGDIAQLTRIIQSTSDDFLAYTGDDILTLPSLSVGAYGVVSVATNIAGTKVKKMIHEFLDGNYDEAMRLNLELTQLYDGLFATTNPVAVKSALNLIGEDVGGCRLPLTDASEEIKILLKKCLSELNQKGLTYA
ncbi:MAG: 4-hydroxy-tetrahydrodipicolinate synthase, partial [Clostridia bacterium]|nr:4-hydroxy-tetrahydrodipicolinate synthase [Clostridia bacterium]